MLILGALACGIMIVILMIAIMIRQRGQSRTADAGQDARGLDLARVILAIGAAAVALIAGTLAISDESLDFRPLSGAVLLFEALTAVLLATLPLRGVWSQRRRSAAMMLALTWVAVGVATLPFFTQDCPCGYGGPLYSPPGLLGADARIWLVIADIAGPVLLLLSASPRVDVRWAKSRS